MKIKVGIIGGAGYTGGEALRLLLLHPNAEIVFVHSKSQAGKPVYSIHQDCLGLTDLNFTNKLESNVDVLFLCLGHGEAKKFLQENTIPAKIKIIDLSQDFRHKESNTFQKRKFVYGLPELNGDAIKKADNIANPGCFATCIQLGLLPLALNKSLTSEIHVSATTGSTGAGQSLSNTTHYSWRQNNLSAYKVFEHQHLKEITESLQQLSIKDTAYNINFVPYRGAFTRGILATIYLESSLSEKQAVDLFQKFYKTHPFVQIASFDVDLKQVVNTNNCFLQIKKVGKQLVIISAIDNLLKGASGQAVQNMNLMFGLDETTALKLKPVAF
ncbi:MAG TPA: N-acetyl-gamma-glutamyl-phosphate reductase [Bacteroidia bacterium]|jgi:N-acetyl-gamma-glutamyl-phosphate reductase|nr:N-acetyl-gamma-glutamyl-phosphate reductase [Bacteroidia bacterium]